MPMAITPIIIHNTILASLLNLLDIFFKLIVLKVEKVIILIRTLGPFLRLSHWFNEI